MAAKQASVTIILPGRKGDVALTAREVETLRYVLLGKTVAAIAVLLSISPRTVENYLSALKKKLGCRNKVDLVEYALAQDFYGLLNLFG